MRADATPPSIYKQGTDTKKMQNGIPTANGENVMGMATSYVQECLGRGEKVNMKSILAQIGLSCWDRKKFGGMSYKQFIASVRGCGGSEVDFVPAVRCLVAGDDDGWEQVRNVKVRQRKKTLQNVRNRERKEREHVVRMIQKFWRHAKKERLRKEREEKLLQKQVDLERVRAAEQRRLARLAGPNDRNDYCFDKEQLQQINNGIHHALCDLRKRGKNVPKDVVVKMEKKGRAAAERTIRKIKQERKKLEASGKIFTRETELERLYKATKDAVMTASKHRHKSLTRPQRRTVKYLACNRADEMLACKLGNSRRVNGKDTFLTDDFKSTFVCTKKDHRFEGKELPPTLPSADKQKKKKLTDLERELLKTGQVKRAWYDDVEAERVAATLSEKAQKLFRRAEKKAIQLVIGSTDGADDFQLKKMVVAAKKLEDRLKRAERHKHNGKQMQRAKQRLNKLRSRQMNTDAELAKVDQAADVENDIRKLEQKVVRLEKKLQGGQDRSNQKTTVELGKTTELLAEKKELLKDVQQKLGGGCSKQALKKTKESRYDEIRMLQRQTEARKYGRKVTVKKKKTTNAQVRKSKRKSGSKSVLW